MITIGITVYNAEKTLRKAIDSALNQTLKAEQMIIVDDCSTDSSRQIIAEYKRLYPEIEHVFNEANSGVAYGRNIIINMARGEYIAFFDDDDVSKPDRLKKQYERIKGYKEKFNCQESVICHTARLQVHQGLTDKYIATLGTNSNVVSPNGPAIAKMILTGVPVKDGRGACATCSQMGKTSDYRELGGFDELFRRSEDTEYNFRFALNGGHFVGISEPLVVQEMQLTDDKNTSLEYQYQLKLLDKYKEFIEQVDSFEFCRDWVELKYDYYSGKSLFNKKLLCLLIKYPIKVLKRIYWALPNFSENHLFRQFHSSKGH